MTLDDETVAEAFEQHEGAPTWQDDPVGRDAAIRWHLRGFEDGRAARDAEVEELRAEWERRGETIRTFMAENEAWSVKAHTAQRRAERAEATLAKLREWAEVSDRPHIEQWDLGYEHATIDVLQILDESPTAIDFDRMIEAVRQEERAKAARIADRLHGVGNDIIAFAIREQK